MNILGEVCMKKRLSVLLSIIIVLSICAPLTSVMAEEARKQSALKTGKEIAALCNEYDNYSNSNDGDKIDNRLMVKTNDNIDEYGAVDSVYGFGYAFLQYADEKSAQKAKENYEKSGYTADYDCVVTSSSTYDKYNMNDEWAYEETDAVSALDYYKLKAKSNINIAVVDSGINYNHELFKNRVVRTKMDFSTDNTGDEMDKAGHGTKVAGAIAKSTPSNVKLFAYKIFDKNLKGTSSGVVAALSYINQLKNKPDIINCSFTTGGLGTEIDELVDMGVTVVASAGNDGKKVYKQPAIFDSVITVAATNQYGYAWSSSSYGSCVDISAPGVSVYTANFPVNNAYAQFSGTSMAAPLVSAAAAYVLMENKKYTPEQVKQELIATATPFKKDDRYNERYGAGIVNFSNIINGTRCKDVTANLQSGVYRDDISVELKSANTLTDIYYTTDGTLPSKTNGTKYIEPINLTETTRITAVAFARAGTPFKSKFTYLDYYIFKDGESEFVVDDGTYRCGIKAYLGNDTNITIPDKINGIEVGSIKERCFKNSNIESVTLPSSVTLIEQQAFYGCDNLKSINLSNVKSIGTEAFTNCPSLTDNIDLSSVEMISERGLAGTYFKTMNLPKCTDIRDSAFEDCTMQKIVLNNATNLGSNVFKNCKNLEMIYAPKVKGFDGCSGCTNLKTVFVPMATGITTDISSNATIYCSGRLTSIYFPNDYSAYKCTIVSPEYTAGLAVANSDGDEDRYIHISSDEIAKDKGGQIRPRDNGLRFGFSFDENSIGFDFAKCADTVEYGFVYTYASFEGKNDFQINYSLRANSDKDNYIKKADKRTVDGTVSTYNAVFTGIPTNHFDDKISARAYVNIDGMYFYSPVITRSYSSASNADDYVGIEEADNDIVFVHEHSFVKSVIAPKCEEKGYTLYKCAKCNESYTENYIDALGHNYKFVSADNSELTYKCSDCDSTVTKTKSELPIFIDYVNTKVMRGNDNMYLDLNNDGYINAKDYALLNKISN
jgi:subtilisin family serine protease/DNA-directed RNA polymerase subunit RPC12/RpoP